MGKNYACTHILYGGVGGGGGRKGKEFESFVRVCNGHEERIKVMYEVREREAVFLDVKVVKEKEVSYRQNCM